MRLLFSIAQPAGCVPPALLWCFACLAVEEHEEPAVTFDESDACVGECQQQIYVLDRR